MNLLRLVWGVAPNQNGQRFRRLPAAYGVAYRMLLALALVSVFAEQQAAAAPAAPESHSTIPLSFRSTADADEGPFSSSNMTVEVVLAPRDEAELVTLLANVYDPNSPSYHQWLVQGEFDTRFAPSAGQIDAVAGFLQSSGLVVAQSSSPFLVRASGPSTMVEAAFGTTLRNYRNAKGIAYFSNASALRIPTSVASGVLGVVGLSNTVRLQAHARRIPGNHANSTAKCETAYPTTDTLYEFYVNGVGFPYGYGGGPGCSGLTPSQDNALYGAPHLGPRGKGAGVHLAVYEFSSYQHSDIETWAHYFYGPGYTPPLVDVLVDGGPLNPICPAGDTCPPDISGYANDIEVDADIEMQLAIAPEASQLLVYNAPNDVTGQANLDLFARIAKDDIADVISDSWIACESDVGAAFAQAENVFLEQTALQGQSFFGSAGDTGAYACIATGTGVMVSVLDPTTQPWVTSVGGTSFESFNPAQNPKPIYPDFIESVWNPDNLCSSQADVLGFPGYAWCGASGAGGGGTSQFWGRPFYQQGPGVTNSYTTYGNGTTQCALAAIGTPCREVPDVSANADEFTPYAEYCTGSAATPNSECAEISGSGNSPEAGGSESSPGWFGIGGTSLSSPLWSAVIADRDGFWHGRIGNANPLLYALYNLDYPGFFHDITGIGQKSNNNGLFPTTPGYDLATGIGTPKMAPIITGAPW
jgi:subtilase family serine protease